MTADTDKDEPIENTEGDATVATDIIDGSLDGYYSDESLDIKPVYPSLDESFDAAVIVTNLPQVAQAKIEKLSKVVTKLFANKKIGALSTSENFNGVHMPFDSTTKKTLGYAFVQYESTLDAKKAVEALNDYPLDKNHTLQVILYNEGMRLRDVPEEFDEPQPEPFVELPNTTSWLTDENQRDEFVIRHGNETEVMWSDGKNDPVMDYDGSRERKANINWCDYYCHWSPLGSFLATLLPQKGVILWGGKEYTKMGRFPTPGVRFIVFSPKEKYMLTSNEDRNDPNAIRVFNVQTGKLLRAFPLFPPDFLSPEQKHALEQGNLDMVPPPPPFQWSFDDSYLARMGKDLISIYETPKMKLLESRSLTAQGIHEFQWCPKGPKNILAYWAPEVGNAPAHVDLIEIPTRKKLRQKNLFNVTKCTMVWQSDGDFLGVKVTRHTKTKKTLYNNFELFRLRDTSIPVEMLDLKDAVMSFAWETGGSRFAIIHAENPTASKVNVSFYDMNKTMISTKKIKGKEVKTTKVVGELNLVDTLKGKQCNCVFWSPAGGVIILAGLGESASGSLEFYDVDTKTLTIKEHYRANEVLWDSSGRTVATCVVQPVDGGHFKFAMDNGFNLWTFQGKQLHQQSYETFYQFQWRPRERLLSKEKIEEVHVNIKKYEKEFERADKERMRALHLEETKEKRMLRSAFRERVVRLKEFRSQQKEARLELLAGYDEDDEDNYVTKEVTLETVLTSVEEHIFLNN